MKKIFFLLVFIITTTLSGYGQSGDSVSLNRNTTPPVHRNDNPKSGTFRNVNTQTRNLTDSVRERRNIERRYVTSVPNNSTIKSPDSMVVAGVVDSSARRVDSLNGNPYQRALSPNPVEHKRVDSSKAAFGMQGIPRSDSSTTDIYFFATLVILLALGFFRYTNKGYIKTLFSVYFNTSLRQSQLTDQLQQAKLQSLILNVFFVIVSGTFLWLLFEHFHIKVHFSKEEMLFFAIAMVTVVYLTKYLFFSFFGWLSGFGETIHRYLFIVFLINKIIGVILIPFVILLLFGNQQWADTVITIGLLSVGFLILSRYIRGYLLLKKGFVLTPFHFMMFFLAVEVIPIMLIYKAVRDYLIV